MSNLNMQETDGFQVRDHVYWDDPDDGLCSGEYIIVGVKGDGWYELSTDPGHDRGSYSEAPPHELRLIVRG